LKRLIAAEHVCSPLAVTTPFYLFIYLFPSFLSQNHSQVSRNRAYPNIKQECWPPSYDILYELIPNSFWACAV